MFTRTTACIIIKQYPGMRREVTAHIEKLLGKYPGTRYEKPWGFFPRQHLLRFQTETQALEAEVWLEENS